MSPSHVKDRPKRLPTRSVCAGPSARLLLIMSLFPLVAGCRGCADSSASPGSGGRNDTGPATRHEEESFQLAMENLSQLEQYDSGRMLQQALNRIIERVSSQQSNLQTQPRVSLAAWPEPEMLRRVRRRVNSWIRSQKLPPDWQPDPLLDTLPAPLRQLPPPLEVGRLEFSRYDVFALREAVWLRDLSAWARGRQLHDVERAKKLFDWTVRNIQLEADAPDRIPLTPWETLLFGRGTAMERAWVLISLARQQGLDAALLALAEPDSPQGDLPTPWVVAVFSQGQLYLFDPFVGLAVPAPGGVQLDETGQLDIQPATLTQTVEDDRVLSQLRARSDRPYPVARSDLKRLVALVVASPTALSARMKLVESHLTPQQRMVLTAAPTRLAERLRDVPYLAEVRLWVRPFQTVSVRAQLDAATVRRQLLSWLPFCAIVPQSSVQGGVSAPLRRARGLHLQGKFTGPKGAIRLYEDARPSDGQLNEMQLEREALYIEALQQSHPQLTDAQRRQMAAQRAGFETAVARRAKQDASYWLGLVAFERGNYTSAIDYFLTRTLMTRTPIPAPNGPWTHGARYNLARTYEASGEHAKAIEQYSSDTASPAYYGNLVRARWLKSLQPDAKPEEEAASQRAAPPEAVQEPPAEIPEPDAPQPEPETPQPPPETPQL